MVRVLRPTSRISPFPAVLHLDLRRIAGQPPRGCRRDMDAAVLVQNGLAARGRLGGSSSVRPRTRPSRPAKLLATACRRSSGNALAVAVCRQLRLCARVRSSGNVLAVFSRFDIALGGLRRSRWNAVRVPVHSGLVLRLLGRSRRNVRLCLQRAGVHVQHDLVAVAGCPPVESPGQRALGHHANRVRLPLRIRRRQLLLRCRHVGRLGVQVGLRRRVPLRLRHIARRLQRPPQHGPYLRRQPSLNYHHPVLVHPGPQRAPVLPALLVGLLGRAVHPPPAADDLLHVCGRAALRRVEQGLLGLRRGHARHGAHLRVGDGAALHGRAQPGQVPQCARHAHVLAGRTRRESRAPAQPVGAGGEAGPAALRVELADEHQQVVGGGLDAGGELGDAVTEPFELGARSRDGREQRFERTNVEVRIDDGQVPTRRAAVQFLPLAARRLPAAKAVEQAESARRACRRGRSR